MIGMIAALIVIVLFGVAVAGTLLVFWELGRRAYLRARKHQEKELPGESGLFPGRYQHDVALWVTSLFGKDNANDPRERGMRFLEEAIELAQAAGIDQVEVDKLVRYVYERPKGNVRQEVGGVSVTLAAFCHAAGVDLGDAAADELRRILRPEVKERCKRRLREKEAAGVVARKG